MKITMDREYTAPAHVGTVKEAMKEFKSRYTDGDLVRAFAEKTGHDITGGEILKCSVCAFPSGWLDDVSFRVEIVTEDSIGFEKIAFYCDVDLVLTDQPLLLTYERYTRMR